MSTRPLTTQAAILVETGSPLVIDEIEIPELKPGQVLVEIAISGVCHTQLLEWHGHRGPDRFLPHCLGHEGSGTVAEIGPGVTKVAVGDRVILSWIKGSGADVPGTVYQWGERSVNSGAITTFSKRSVISENRLTPLPEGISMQEAAVLGCAVSTGLGSVFNTLRPSPGQSMAVLGCGGIGLCAVAGAAIAGCHPVIAVDVLPDRLDRAARLGATHTIDASHRDPVEEIRAICPGGADFAVEASGRPEVMQQALAAVRNQGGAAVVVGNAHHGQRLELDPLQLNLGKQLRGTWGGDTVPDRDLPRYCKLLEARRLTLEPLIATCYPLSRINEALKDLEQGRTARPLIDMSLD